jgi:hypothetical protein
VCIHFIFFFPVFIGILSVWGVHVTVTGHMGAGTGYRNEFQTENSGPLTTQALFLYGVCSFSQLQRMIL